MRSIEELPPLGFQDWGASWVRWEYDITLAADRSPFHLQLSIYVDDTTWSRIEAYATHDMATEQLWWSFDLSGNEMGAGGDHDAVLSAYAGGADAEDEFYGESGKAQTYYDLKQKAAEAVTAVLAALPATG